MIWNISLEATKFPKLRSRQEEKLINNPDEAQENKQISWKMSFRKWDDNSNEYKLATGKQTANEGSWKP